VCQGQEGEAGKEADTNH